MHWRVVGWRDLGRVLDDSRLGDRDWRFDCFVAPAADGGALMVSVRFPRTDLPAVMAALAAQTPRPR